MAKVSESLFGHFMSQYFVAQCKVCSWQVENLKKVVNTFQAKNFSFNFEIQYFLFQTMIILAGLK